MLIRTLLATALLTTPLLAIAEECTQEALKGNWQLDLVRVGGESGLGMRCTLAINKNGKIKVTDASTACSYALESTPRTSGNVIVTDTPTACIADIQLKITGAASGRKAFLQTSVRMNEDVDYADRYDALLQDQDGEEIFSGPISFYKY